MKQPPNIEKIVAVDFDKTICDSKYPVIGGLKPGVLEALTKIMEAGYWIIVWSCRTCKFYPEVFNPTNEPLDLSRPTTLEMISYLDTNKVPYDDVDDGTMGKVYAAYYVDDKAVRYNENWNEIAEFITGGSNAAVAD